MPKYDVKQVPREVLEALAQVFLDALGSPAVCSVTLCTKDAYVEQLGKAAKVKLRTRVEVDADIADAVREYRRQWMCPLTYNSRFDYKGRTDIYLGEVVNPLVSEETEG